MRKLPGIIPIFILIAIGIVIAAAGGTYIVRNQFVKKGQTGKAALDEEKIRQQIENPQPLEEPSPQPTPKLAPTVYQYKPPKISTVEEETQEPGFTINPPSGWGQTSSAKVKIGFLAPEEDEEPAEPPLTYKYTANIQVVLKKIPQEATLDQVVEATVDSYQSAISDLQIISNTPTPFASQDGQFLEFIGEYQYGAKLHLISYLTIKNGYAVSVSGVALDSAWDKRENTIKNSINTLTFTD